MRHLRFLFVALTIGAWAAGPLPTAVAQTAPSYQSSSPSKGEMLDHPPSEVTVTFNQPIDDSSWMTVLDECGNELHTGSATVDVNELSVQIGDKTPSGNWEVVYKAVGLAGATGSSGSSFEFMVHHGSPCGGGGETHHHGGGGKKNGHGGHGGHGDGDGHEGMDHEGMGSGHDDHSTMPGMTGMPGHSGHTMTSGPGHDAGHGPGHGNHHGGGDGPAPGGGGTELPPQATGGTGTLPVGADGQAVLLGLGLALAVGVLGGWLLRLSGNLAG